MVLDRVVVPRPNVQKDYLAYLITHQRLADAHAAALRIARRPGTVSTFSTTSNVRSRPAAPRAHWRSGI